MPLTSESQDPNSLHLNQESGHSFRRVVHSADRTGQVLQNTLLHQVMQQDNISLVKNCVAVDLICDAGRTSQGAYILDCTTSKVHTVAAKVVALATGGIGKIYLYTSNSDEATGDGIAMAWRAGCPVANMEFIQFHPTCLYHPAAKSFLLSETLRGEDAKLRLPNGELFMACFDHRAELAPRDIVAQAIDQEMKRLGIPYVLLDISHRDSAFIKRCFPTIYQKCLQFGYDITTTAIPVVPAMHYSCGGIVTSLEGKSTLQNLYAIGEVAYTGLHGANRMASNSLLECLVFAKWAAHSIAQQLEQKQTAMPTVPRWDDTRVTVPSEEIMISHNWHELRQTMSNYVGIVRTEKRLHAALQRVNLLSTEIEEYYHNHYVNKNLLELRNIALVAKLIILSAISRHESRGLHVLEDYPETDPVLDNKATYLTPPDFGVSAQKHSEH